MAFVYRHIRLDNGNPFYIGIGKSETRKKMSDSRNKYVLKQQEIKKLLN